MKNYLFRVLAIGLGLTLIAAACSGDDSENVANDVTSQPSPEEEAGEPAADPDPEREEGPEAEEPEREEDPEAEEPPEEDPEAEEPEREEDPEAEEPPEELTASFRGVTADTIKVGVIVPDWDALQAMGVPNYQGSTEVAYQAFFDVINQSGGIYGRQIEPYYATMDFLNQASQEAACVELTEDHEVFIVLRGTLAAANLCFTDLHDTMLMTVTNLTEELKDASGDTLWLQTRPTDDAHMEILGRVLAKSGRLDGRTIGIVANAIFAEGAMGTTLQEVLADEGFESRVVVVQDATDAITREAEFAIVAERFSVDGVDFAFDLIGGSNLTEIFHRQGYMPEMGIWSMAGATTGTTDRSVLDGAVSVGALTDESSWEDPELWENCMNVVLEANPELAPEFEYIPTSEQQAAGEPSWLPPIRAACNITNILKQVGEIAGADLTNDSFRAALDELGPIQLYGLGQATFSSEKWDGLDEFYILVYDAATDSVVIEGDPIIVDRG